MGSIRKRWPGLALLAIAVAGAAPAPASDPVAATVDLLGTRLDMTRPAMLARLPGDCTGRGEGAPAHLFARCGPRNLSAGFTGAGRAWWITASLDLTGTAVSSQGARQALLRRYGPPADLGHGTLIWLPAGSHADPARCLAEATLLTAAADTDPRDRTGALPAVGAGCLPIRSALLAEQGSHRGLIVQLRDPRARVAELAR